MRSWWKTEVPYAIDWRRKRLLIRELHEDKNSSPFPPRTPCFVPITAATAVIQLNLSPLPRLKRFHRGNQCKFFISCPHYRSYRGKSENPFPITAVKTAVIQRLPRSVLSCRSLLLIYFLVVSSLHSQFMYANTPIYGEAGSNHLGAVQSWIYMTHNAPSQALNARHPFIP